MLAYTVPQIFVPFEDLVAIETTRHGGISPVPYHTLNLGINTDDDLVHIDKNRAIICQKLGIEWSKVVFGKQVHGAKVVRVSSGGCLTGYDAFITDAPDVFLSITVADCAPIMIFDSRTRACGVAHAGWRGAAAQIGTRTLESMKTAFGTDPMDCFVYIGTCLSAAHLEVGGEVKALFDERFSIASASPGKFLLDLKSAILSEMVALSVPIKQIEVSNGCTWRDESDYFSHRRSGGTTGRFMVLMGQKSTMKGM
jgi:polyphenol oxidase